MTLAAALTAFAELVGDSIVNDAGRPVPGRILRYHGHAPPEDMECSADGILSAWWEGTMSPSSNGPCGGPPTVTLGARWVTCWKLATVQSTGITLYDDAWDGRAAELADTAEAVARRLTAVQCGVEPGDERAAAFAAFHSGQSYSFIGAEPRGAAADVAGVTWRVRFALKAQATVTS